MRGEAAPVEQLVHLVDDDHGLSIEAEADALRAVVAALRWEQIKDDVLPLGDVEAAHVLLRTPGRALPELRKRAVQVVYGDRIPTLSRDRRLGTTVGFEQALWQAVGAHGALRVGVRMPREKVVSRELLLPRTAYLKAKADLDRLEAELKQKIRVLRSTSRSATQLADTIEEVEAGLERHQMQREGLSRLQASSGDPQAVVWYVLRKWESQRGEVRRHAGRALFDLLEVAPKRYPEAFGTLCGLLADEAYPEPSVAKRYRWMHEVPPSPSRSWDDVRQTLQRCLPDPLADEVRGMLEADDIQLERLGEVLEQEQADVDDLEGPLATVRAWLSPRWEEGRRKEVDERDAARAAVLKCGDAVARRRRRLEPDLQTPFGDGFEEQVFRLLADRSREGPLADEARHIWRLQLLSQRAAVQLGADTGRLRSRIGRLKRALAARWHAEIWAGKPARDVYDAALSSDRNGD